MKAEDKEERVRWRGDEEGVCPVCHSRLFQVSRDSLTVDCVVCGDHGTPKIKDGKLIAEFTEEELNRSRLKWGGKLEHMMEIKSQAQPAGTIKNLKELKAPYGAFNPSPLAPNLNSYGNLKQ